MTECQEVVVFFTGVKKHLIADEQTQLVTECEIIWTKIKTKNNEDLYLSSFYMPHRNLKDLKNLDSSLKKLSEHSKVNTFFWLEISTAWISIGIHSLFFQMHQTAKYNILSLTFLLSMDLHKYMTNQRAKKTY